MLGCELLPEYSLVDFPSLDTEFLFDPTDFRFELTLFATLGFSGDLSF